MNKNIFNEIKSAKKYRFNVNRYFYIYSIVSIYSI
jgi:hypothetical protein